MRSAELIVAGGIIRQPNHEPFSMSAAPRLPNVEDLPPPRSSRWTIWRKAAVVAAVHNGTISRDEVCRIYNISTEEFLNWERLLGTHGPAGLRVTRAQKYRGPKP